MSGFPAMRAKEFSGDLRVLSGSPKDNGTAWMAFGQAVREQVVYALELAGIGARLHLEEQVVSFDAAGKEFQFPTSLGFEVGQDFLPYVLFAVAVKQAMVGISTPCSLENSRMNRPAYR